jgi:hypothetical protein
VGSRAEEIGAHEEDWNWLTYLLLHDKCLPACGFFGCAGQTSKPCPKPPKRGSERHDPINDQTACSQKREFLDGLLIGRDKNRFL